MEDLRHKLPHFLSVTYPQFSNELYSHVTNSCNLSDGEDTETNPAAWCAIA